MSVGVGAGRDIRRGIYTGGGVVLSLGGEKGQFLGKGPKKDRDRFGKTLVFLVATTRRERGE